MTSLSDVFESRAKWCVAPCDNRFGMAAMPSNSVDAIVCDPPYGLGAKEPKIDEIIAYLSGAVLDTGGDFMGKDWHVPTVGMWREMYRIMKPGAHLLAFAGTRTMDIISLGIRAAGFTNRDTVAYNFGGPEVLEWQYGSGFPKSKDALRTDIIPAIEQQLRDNGITGEITWR